MKVKIKKKSEKTGIWGFPRSAYGKAQLGLTSEQVAEIQMAVTGGELVKLTHRASGRIS
ncbi:MAG TPA: hypothetical protein VJI33_04945 [Candidatus Paceibacterota bacterium]